MEVLKGKCLNFNSIGIKIFIWRPPSLSELTPIIFTIELTHLGSDNSLRYFKIFGGLRA